MKEGRKKDRWADRQTERQLHVRLGAIQNFFVFVESQAKPTEASLPILRFFFFQ